MASSKESESPNTSQVLHKIYGALCLLTYIPKASKTIEKLNDLNDLLSVGGITFRNFRESCNYLVCLKDKIQKSVRTIRKEETTKVYKYHKKLKFFKNFFGIYRATWETEML